MTQPATITLRPVDRSNWHEVTELEVAPDQKHFVATNAYSIAESKFYEPLRPCAIYVDHTLVGFVMYGRDDEDKQFWIYRFMIDQQFQRRGYGRAALLETLKLIRSEPNAPEANIGYELSNIGARTLYASIGFVEQGITSWGEMGAKLIF